MKTFKQYFKEDDFAKGDEVKCLKGGNEGKIIEIKSDDDGEIYVVKMNDKKDNGDDNIKEYRADEIEVESEENEEDDD